MYQATRELRAAPGRTALITVTVGLIAVLVTFLSALAAGLSHRSTSALDELLGPDDAVMVTDSGATSLAASRLTTDQVSAAERSDAAEAWSVGRARVGDEPVFVFPDSSLAPGEIRPSRAVADDLGDAGSTTLDGHDVTIVGDAGDLWWEHQPVVLAAPGLAEELAGAASAIVVDESGSATAPEVEGTVVMRGDERMDLSASNVGEQTSLGAMTALLYVISALVVGAFFMVWTVQRMRGVAVSSALGASRPTLVADSLGQAVIVLLVGVGAGVAITVAGGAWLASSDVMPVVIDAGTTLWPGLLLGATGLIGAAVALVPVLRVEPREALANA
ncbi:ABC transporter permease [uncultured Corynebacterium sp.]|uniref:ABC transporter permease n=1 Tax=uncultured Corynebacterium sp. TaxID=159447 RepID=UPI0025CF7BC4|nr:ABC transporter permease [uncultured Corynebacterium sp.]